MVNRWLVHVKAVAAGNKGKGLKEILKMAKKTYKKSPGVHKKERKKTHRKRRRKTHKKRKTKHHKKRKTRKRKTRKHKRR